MGMLPAIDYHDIMCVQVNAEYGCYEKPSSNLFAMVFNPFLPHR